MTMFNRKLTFTPLIIEVVGQMDDVLTQQISTILHSYRNRYSPLFRLLCTLSNLTCDDENEFFAHLASKANMPINKSRKKFQCAHALQHAVSIASLNYIPVIKRLYSTSKKYDCCSPSSSSCKLPSSQLRLSAHTSVSLEEYSREEEEEEEELEQEEEENEQLVNYKNMFEFYTKRLISAESGVLDQLETFMTYYFLPLCITHNFMNNERALKNSIVKETELYRKWTEQTSTMNEKTTFKNNKKRVRHAKKEDNKHCQEEEEEEEEEQEEEQEPQTPPPLQQQQQQKQFFSLSEETKESCEPVAHFLEEKSHNCYDNDRKHELELSDIENFILRHYVHESTRTCSFLIADTLNKEAALIDPHCNIDDYVHDLHKFDLELVYVIYTHCFVDITVGVAELQSKFPHLTVISGLVKKQDENDSVIRLSEKLSLHITNVPSFAPESLIVALHVNSICVALFTGTALSTDSLPSTEYFRFSASEQYAYNNNCNNELTQENFLSACTLPFAFAPSTSKTESCSFSELSSIPASSECRESNKNLQPSLSSQKLSTESSVEVVTNCNQEYNTSNPSSAVVNKHRNELDTFIKHHIEGVTEKTTTTTTTMTDEEKIMQIAQYYLKLHIYDKYLCPLHPLHTQHQHLESIKSKEGLEHEKTLVEVKLTSHEQKERECEEECEEEYEHSLEQEYERQRWKSKCKTEDKYINHCNDRRCANYCNGNNVASIIKKEHKSAKNVSEEKAPEEAVEEYLEEKQIKVECRYEKDDENAYNQRQQIILFPSRGGYNNGVTSQLDLYWAVSVRDFTHMSHSQRVSDAITTFDKYVKFMKLNSINNNISNDKGRNSSSNNYSDNNMQQLKPPRELYKSIWRYNYDLLMNAHAHDNLLSNHRNGISVIDSHRTDTYLAGNKANTVAGHHVRDVVAPHVCNRESCISEVTNYKCGKLVHSFHYSYIIDVRSLTEYQKQHLRYSIHVPMSFPPTAFNAKKAEIWLQHLLLPNSLVLVVYSSKSDDNKVGMTSSSGSNDNHDVIANVRDQIKERFRLIAPTVNTHIYPIEEIDQMINAQQQQEQQQQQLEPNYNENDKNDMKGTSDATHTKITKQTVAKYWQPLQWVYPALENNHFTRVSTAQELLEITSCNAAHNCADYVTVNKIKKTRNDVKICKDKLSKDIKRCHLETEQQYNEHSEREHQEQHEENSSTNAVNGTLVIDIRTYAEFKNGSHVNSIHVPLSEICSMVVEEATNNIDYTNSVDSKDCELEKVYNVNNNSSSSNRSNKRNENGEVQLHKEFAVYVPSAQLAELLLNKLHLQALRANISVCDKADEVKRIVLYCASGYRTLIAASLLQRAFDAAIFAMNEHSNICDDNNNNSNNNCNKKKSMEYVKDMKIQDVEGGALQIMTRRPDSWVLKDRSIICISWPRETVK